MSFSLNQMMVEMGDSIYFDEGFRIVLETHMVILRKDTATRRVLVPPELAYQYQGDLYGLLGTSQFNQAFGYRWLVMRVNGLYNPADYGLNWDNQYAGAHDFSLLLPSEEYVSQLARKYKTTSYRT